MLAVATWLAWLLGPPIFAARRARVDDDLRRVRTIAIVCALASCVTAALAPAIPQVAALEIAWPWDETAALGTAALRMTSLSRPLVALVPALWLVTVAATPVARLDRAGFRRTAYATSVGALAFVSDSPAVLLCCWWISSSLFIRGLAGATNPRTQRVIARYHGVAVASLAAGVAVVAWRGEADVVGLGLIMAAVAIRKGIVPFHAWIPEALDRGRIGPTVSLCAPQLGSYVAVVLVVPYASAGMLRVVAIASLLTAVYGAALALYVSDARRSLGYLFVSQSALVLAGLDCTSPDALAGALILWVSSALAFTGLARTVLALEARRGRLSLAEHHGGHDQMPLLAATFLVFGLAATGFPGTLGFVGQEMLVDGAVRTFPFLGFLTIGSAALTGLAVMRMYLSLFGGARSRGPELSLRPREKIIFAAIAAALVVGGLVPGPLLASRAEAAHRLLQQRGAITPSTRPPTHG